MTKTKINMRESYNGIHRQRCENYQESRDVRLQQMLMNGQPFDLRPYSTYKCYDCAGFNERCDWYVTKEQSK